MKPYIFLMLTVIITINSYSQTDISDICDCLKNLEGIFLRDFTTKHSNKPKNNLIGTWIVNLNEVSKYMFILCEKYNDSANLDYSPRKTYLELYDNTVLLKSTLNSGIPKKSFNFICLESKSYKIIIKVTDEKNINTKKLYFVGILSLISVNK